MGNARYKEKPLPAGSTYLRVNHIEVFSDYGQVPRVKFAIEERTVLEDGQTSGRQLDTEVLIFDNPETTFPKLNRNTGAPTDKLISYDDLYNILWSAANRAMELRDARLGIEAAAALAAETLQAERLQEEMR